MTTPVLKVKVLPKPVVKGKMDVRFPASVSAQSPILLANISGNYSFSLDVNALRLSLDQYYLSSQVHFSDIQGNLSVSQMNSGTGADNTKFWRGDGVWATPSGSGDMLKANNLSDLTNLSTARRNLGVPPFRIPVTPGQALKAFGDSITVGTGASVAATYGYIQRLAQYLRAPLTNAAVSGTGSNSITFTSFSTLAKYNRPHEVVTWMGSHNDIYRGGTNAKTITKLKGELRSFLANAFLLTAVPASDSTLTKTGTWVSGAGIREKAAASLGGSLRYSQTTNDTITGSFTGDNFVVGAFASDGVSLHVGTFTVSIDGASSGPGFATYNGDGLADGISDGVYDNKLTHDVVVMTGLGVGSHTFTIKLTSASASFPVYIDYIGTMNYPTAAAPVIVYESSRPNTAGYSLGGGVWSPAAFDLADAAINSVVAEFYNFPVVVAKTSFYQNTTTDIGVDNEHPNDLGHFHLEQAAMEVIDIRRLPFVSGSRFSVSAAISAASGTNTPIAYDLSAYDDEGLHSTSVNNSRINFVTSGTYSFSGYVTYAANATGLRSVGWRKNGGATTEVCAMPAGSGSTTTVPFQIEVDGVQGDYIEIIGAQNSGGALNITASQVRVTQTR